MRYYSPKSVSDERNYYEMYQIYRTHAESCNVIRSGSGLFGAPYDYNQAANDARSGRRGESVAEHAYLSIVKLYALYDRFPTFYPCDPYEHKDPYAFLNQIHLLLSHDLAENETGDIPDDGGRDDHEKLLIEKRFMDHHATHFSADTGETLAYMFTSFNAVSDAGAIPHVAEKSEAISRTALYEANGFIGHFAYKKDYYGPATPRDLESIAATGSDSQLDGWTYQFIKRFRGKPSFREFFGEILVGTMVARNGEVFPWCDDDLLHNYDLNKLRRIVDGSDEE